MRLQGACLAVTDSALTGLPVSPHGGPCRVRHVVGVGQITVQCRGGSFDHVHEAQRCVRRMASPICPDGRVDRRFRAVNADDDRWGETGSSMVHSRLEGHLWPM